jgi:hypothetical protein
MTGSSSSLRKHIARYESLSSLIRILIVFRFHVEVYRKRCKEKGIEPNTRALFKVPEDSSTDR